MIVGHAHVLAQLAEELPPVTLLAGPPSVGKKSLARHLAALHRVHPADLHTAHAPLTAATARAVVCFVGTAGFGPFKLVLADLDGASEAGLGVLLKTLEEPPDTARIILTAAGRVLPTVASRAAVFRLGLLSDDQVADVLIAAGMAPGAAARTAPTGRGRVAPARLGPDREAARTTALAVAKAVATRDPDLLDKAFAGFDEVAHGMLIAWCVEIITGRWAQFTPEQAFDLDRGRARRVLGALSLFPHARPRLADRAALSTLLLA